MNYAAAVRDTAHYTTTENGAVALRSTGDARLDLYACIGGLRDESEECITRLFAEAYEQDPLFATRILFYARDVRGGLGERETFRKILRYLAQYHPEALQPNLDLIGVYGRYDDLYALVDTPLENEMWAVMKAQLEEDLRNMREGNAVSLLAKWIKTADASSRRTRQLGILTARRLGYSVYEFKRLVRALRRATHIVETQMSAGKWDEIRYEAVPSRAMMLYRKAFYQHDEERYRQFINKALQGEETIHAGTLYPYDIVEKYMEAHVYEELECVEIDGEEVGIIDMSSGTSLDQQDEAVLEAQWRQLPNYVKPGTNALVIADVSGSMTGRPMATAVGLAIYFAQRNAGAYHNLFMEFSTESRFVELRGDTLAQQIEYAMEADWGCSTNLAGAFMRILETAVMHQVPREEMPKALIVISDMEIDACGDQNWSFYDRMKAMYASQGYDIPNVIFWNVCSRHDVFHADARRKGVQLVSGQSASTFQHLMENVDLTPVEAMERVINGERYRPIRVA